MTENISYKDILKNNRKKRYKKHSKLNLITFNNDNGLECDKFDVVLNEDLHFFYTFNNIIFFSYG